MKFWWKLQKHSVADFQQQAKQILDNAVYFKAQLDAIGYPAWRNPYSNTVFFKRPSQAIMDRYDRAMDRDDRLGGDLAHMIVMQNESRAEIDQLVNDLKPKDAKK